MLTTRHAVRHLQPDRSPGFPGVTPALRAHGGLSFIPFAPAVATGSNPGITLTKYSRPECPAFSLNSQAAHTAPAPAGPLSLRQVVIRRGATLGAASVLLGVGLLVRMLTTPSY